MARPGFSRMKPLAWTAAIVFALDQVTKWIVVHWMNLIELRQIEVIPGFIEFQMAWNRGVNFGLGAGMDARWWLIGISFAISAAVLVWLWRSGTTRWGYISAGLLIGGAMGNVVDRLFQPERAVADFLNVTCCGIANPFAFNVADVAIFLGAIGLAFLSEERKPKTR